MKTYLSKDGARLFSMTKREYLEFSNGSCGFCLSCGVEHSQVEPDAQGYICTSCEEPTVMGIEDMLLEGLITLD
jgi:hypothetical protein